MQVLMDQQPVEMEIPQGLPLAGLVERVRALAAGRQRVLANMAVEGQPIQVESLEQWLARPCDQLGRVEFVTACPRQLAHQTIQEASALFGEIGQWQQGAAEKLSAGQTGKAMEQLLACLVRFKAAQEAVSDAVQLNRLDLDGLMVAGRPMAQVIGELSARLAEIRAALKSSDLALLGDLLNYEFPKITGQWQAILGELGRRLA